MGKLNEKEIIIASIAGILFSPFIIVGKFIKSVGISLGLIKEPIVTPVQPPPPAVVPPADTIISVEVKPTPHIYQPGELGYTENKLDPNS